MSNTEFSQIDFVLDALERQQAAARRRGYFPTFVFGKKTARADSVDFSEGAVQSTRLSADDLHTTNLEISPWRDNPGIAKADLLTEKDAPKKLDTVMERLISTQGWKPRLAVAALEQQWPVVVGAENAQHCWVESFDERNGVLRLGTRSQIWATQFRLLLPTIQAEIAKFVGHGLVNQVIVLGPEATATRQRNPE